MAIIATTVPSGYPRDLHRRVIGWEREGNNVNTARLVVKLTDITACYAVNVTIIGGITNGNVNIDTPYDCTTQPFKFKSGTTVTFSLNNYNSEGLYKFTHWSSSAGTGLFIQDKRLLTGSIKIDRNVTLYANFYKKPPMLFVHGFQGFNFSEPYQYNCGTGANRYTELRGQILPNTEIYRYNSLIGAVPEVLLEDYDVWFAEWYTGPAGTALLEANAFCLMQQVDTVYQATGRTNKLVIVAHSMGGLVTRGCLLSPTCARGVREVYTNGSPHNGLAAVESGIVLITLMGILFPELYIAEGAICAWQQGMCQLAPTYIENIFNPTHPNLSTVSYRFLGGYDGRGSLAYPILNWFDDNDGLIGRRSAVGLGPTQYDSGSNTWKQPVFPFTFWIPRTHHIQAWGLADLRDTADYYFSADLDSLSQNDNRIPGKTLDCLKWLLGYENVFLPNYCQFAPPTGQVLRNGLAQTANARPQSTDSRYGTVQSSETLTFTLPIDESGQSVFYIGWSDGVLDFTLNQPDGTLIDPAYAQANGNIVQYSQTLTPTEWTPRMAGYVFTNTLPGLWTLNITGNSVGPSGIKFLTAAGFQSERKLVLSTDAQIYRPGDTAVLQAQLSNGSGGLTGATVTADIRRASITDTVTFTEQSSGFYTANYVIPDEPGLIFATVKASGNDGALAYSRSGGLLLMVARDSLQLTGEYSDGPNDSDGDGRNDTLEVQVGVNALLAGDYTLSANLEKNGQIIASSASPVNLGVGSQTVSLSFSGDAIRLAGLNGPFTLTNLNILDHAAGDLPVVTANNVWTTGSYNWGDFGTCYSLIRDIDTVGAGAITTIPAPDCVSALGDRYASGTVVTVTATANTGFTFLGWSGDLNDTTAATQLTMDGDKSIQAFFWTEQKLQLTSMCSPNPTSYRVWRVRNYNPFTLNFTWDVYNTSQNGSGSVPALEGSTPGEVTFQTTTVSGSNTTRIFVNGVLQDTKASTTATCP